MNNNLFGLAAIGRGLINTAREEPPLDSVAMKRLVFAKARASDWNGFAYDDNGKPIFFSHYGDRNSVFGWEYDHWPTPKAQGGPDISAATQLIDQFRVAAWRRHPSSGQRLRQLMQHFGLATQESIPRLED